MGGALTFRARRRKKLCGLSAFVTRQARYSISSVTPLATSCCEAARLGLVWLSLMHGALSLSHTQTDTGTYAPPWTLCVKSKLDVRPLFPGLAEEQTRSESV